MAFDRLPSTMQAIQVTQDGNGQNTILLRSDVPIPQPSSSQLLIKIAASAINPSDVLNVTGKFPHTTYPRIPGRDFAGTVVAAPASSPISIGAEVYGTSGKDLSFTEDGAHAEYLMVPVEGAALKPKTLSVTQAAAIGTPYTTAMLALKRTAAQKGESVLVLGASGSVGSAVSQMAVKLGCQVIGAARRDGYSVSLRDDPTLQSVQSLTNGKGADVCIDTVGNAELMHAAVKSLAVGGRLGVISSTGPDPVLHVDVRALYRAQLSIVGCNSVECSIGMMTGLLREITPWFEGGDLSAPMESSLTKIGMGQMKAAYEDLIAGRAKGKKFVLVCTDTQE